MPDPNQKQKVEVHVFVDANKWGKLKNPKVTAKNWAEIVAKYSEFVRTAEGVRFSLEAMPKSIVEKIVKKYVELVKEDAISTFPNLTKYGPYDTEKKCLQLKKRYEVDPQERYWRGEWKNAINALESQRWNKVFEYGKELMEAEIEKIKEKYEEEEEEE